MTSSQSPGSAWVMHRRRLAEANDLNKTAVFDILAASGIKNVVVDFDGEQFQGIAAQIDGNTVGLPTATVTTYAAPWGAKALAAREQGLDEAIEALCYGYLEHGHDGWENDDGAYGEFRFDVRGRTIALEFNARISDIFTETTEL